MSPFVIARHFFFKLRKDYQASFKSIRKIKRTQGIRRNSCRKSMNQRWHSHLKVVVLLEQPPESETKDFLKLLLLLAVGLTFICLCFSMLNLYKYFPTFAATSRLLRITMFLAFVFYKPFQPHRILKRVLFLHVPGQESHSHTSAK